MLSLYHWTVLSLLRQQALDYSPKNLPVQGPDLDDKMKGSLRDSGEEIIE